MNPFEAYVMFQAIKRHFNSDYDFVKYRGKVKADPLKFDTRKDKYFYYKLSKKDDPLSFCLSNIIENQDIWVGDLFDEKATYNYHEWLKRTQSSSYHFETQLPVSNEDLLVTDGKHPTLYKKYRRHEYSLENLIILDSLLGFFKYWDKKIDDTILWPSTYKLICNYTPFITFDKQKCKKILAKSL